MAVKKSNKRIMITLSKNQVNWLEKFCKKHGTTPSKYIKFLLSVKAEEMLYVLGIIDINTKEYEELTEELQQIIKTKWID